jgi:tetratricopeptide (TPR) repeat protein
MKAAVNFRAFFLRCLPVVFIVAGLVGADLSLAKDKKDKPVPPPTKQTQVIRPDTYKKMEVAQKAFEAKDYKGSLAALDGLKVTEGKLNDYERATLYNLYAATYYSMDNVPKAIESYKEVLKQPKLPEALRDNSLYAMAQLHFISEEYAKTIAVVQQWLSVVTTPSPEGYALLAQAYYQTQKYAEAEKALVTSIQISRERGQVPKEAALALLRAIYYERKEYAKAAKVLEILVTVYPGKGSYWQQLAGMRGLLDQQRQQLSLMHAAYRAKLLVSESETLNLARLYMVQDAPYPAVRLLAKGFKDKSLKFNAENLQLFAQALAMAKEFEQQIPVLKKLAEMTSDAKNYIYLGQAYNETGDWANAAEAYRAALRSKNVEKASEIHMQLGTALFNANQFVEARAQFLQAATSPGLQETAGKWVKFVDQEIERREAVKNF